MSFYSNCNHQENCPGPISSNPINGLCEKTCVQVKKVFDACIKQVSMQNFIIPVTNIPCGSTFISGRSTTSKGSVKVCSVEPIDSCQNLSRVRADVTIPIEILYTAPSGCEQCEKSCITLKEDVLMCLPEPSIMPFEFEAVVSVVIPEGCFTGASTLSAEVCVTAILKVVIEAELLVPTYGYCPIPPCQEYTQEVCAGFFDLPLFPKTPCCKK